MEQGEKHDAYFQSCRLGFLAEILTYPNGEYDGQVDSTSQFLMWMDE